MRIEVNGRKGREEREESVRRAYYKHGLFRERREREGEGVNESAEEGEEERRGEEERERERGTLVKHL